MSDFIHVLADANEGDTFNRRGPRLKSTRTAQKMIDEFLECDTVAAYVSWTVLDEDFDRAKAILSGRILNCKHKDEKYQQVAIRSDRRNGAIYLVRKDKI